MIKQLIMVVGLIESGFKMIFIGDNNNTNYLEIDTLTRYFYYPCDAVVNIRYDMIFACTDDSDYTSIKMNNLELLHEKMNIFDNFLATYFDDDNLVIDSINIQNCNEEPYRKAIFVSSTALPADQFNELKIEMTMHHNQQVSYITDLSIECINSTLDPTFDPTSAPSIPTINPTMYPTDPTNDPTNDPTVSPSPQPTVNPTKSYHYSYSNRASVPSIINCTESCSIYCTSFACRSKTLYCPINGDCSVTCNTGVEGGCQFTSIHAENSLSLLINNIGSASKTFRYTVVYCPLNGPCHLRNKQWASLVFNDMIIYNFLGFSKYSQFNVECLVPNENGDGYCGWSMDMRCGHEYSGDRVCEFPAGYWKYCPDGEGDCWCTDPGLELGCCASRGKDQFCMNVFMTLPTSGQIWIDDFKFEFGIGNFVIGNNAIEYEGWYQLDSDGNDISKKVFTSDSTNIKYHGPFVGDSNTDSDNIEINTLTRYFYCPYDSIIDINYDIIFACTTELDYTSLKINDLEILNEKMNSFDNIQAEDFNDNNLKIDSINNQNCNGNPFRKSIFGSYPRTFPETTLNELIIEMAMHSNDQVSYITNLTIQCINSTFYPTFDPTTSPTIDPTKSPTIEPTPEPTKEPTELTTTVDPTMRPTKKPTELGMTHDPTIKPTKQPNASGITVNPTLTQTEEPANPTITPTVTPTSESQIIITKNGIQATDADSSASYRFYAITLILANMVLVVF